MKTLASRDVQLLLDVIQDIYAIGDVHSFGSQVLKIINQIVPSEVPEFHITNPQSWKAHFSFLPGHADHYIAYGIAIDEIMRLHAMEHPIVCNMPRTLVGAHKVSDFLTYEELEHLEGLYHKFMRTVGFRDQMTVFLSETQPKTGQGLVQQRSPLVGLSLNRSQCNFTERDRLILNLLRSHLSQAYENAQYRDHLQHSLNQLQQSLDRTGAIFLNQNGQAQAITAQASRWLQAYFPGILAPRHLPETLQSWVNHQLAQLQRTNAPYPALLPLKIQQADRQLTIRFTIDQPNESYLLLLGEEQLLSPLSALKLLGLSHREAEVVLGVVQGQDNGAIAQALRISPGTVRKHLENIYRKLDVQSRSEAIAKVMQTLG